MSKAQTVQPEDKLVSPRMVVSPSGESVNIVKPIPERKAGVRVIELKEKGESNDVDTSETLSKEPISERSATIIYKQTVAEPEESEDIQTPEKVKGEEASSEELEGKESVEDKEELPEKFKGKTKAEIVKTYKELESLTTKLAQKNLEMEKSLVLKTKDNIPDIEIPDNFSELVMDDPKKAKRVLSDTINSAVAKAVANIREETNTVNEESDKESARKFVLENYPSYYDSEHSATVNALATNYTSGTYLERYKKACEDYTRLRSDVKGELKKEVQKEIQETEEMKTSAVVPQGAPKKASKKTYLRRSDINYMITKDPIQYVKRQDEIFAAVREKRVIEDA